MWYLKCCIREGWDTFVRYVMCSVGNGTLIHFLHVIKCEDPCLKDSFPKLFWIVVDRMLQLLPICVVNTAGILNLNGYLRIGNCGS